MLLCCTCRRRHKVCRTDAPDAALHFRAGAWPAGAARPDLFLIYQLDLLPHHGWSGRLNSRNRIILLGVPAGPLLAFRRSHGQSSRSSAAVASGGDPHRELLKYFTIVASASRRRRACCRDTGDVEEEKEDGVVENIGGDEHPG